MGFDEVEVVEISEDPAAATHFLNQLFIHGKKATEWPFIFADGIPVGVCHLLLLLPPLLLLPRFLMFFSAFSCIGGRGHALDGGGRGLTKKTKGYRRVSCVGQTQSHE